MTFKSHIILSNTKNPRFKTVNIVTSTVGYQKEEISTRREDTNCETVQDSGGIVKGLPTICVPGYSGGGGGGGSYSAKAVHFDGNTWLSTDSLTALDSGPVSSVYWFRKPAPTSHNMVLWVADPNSGANFGQINGNSGSVVEGLATQDFNHVAITGTDDSFADDAWHCVITSFSGKSGDSIVMYVGDVSPPTNGQSIDADIVPVFNGLPFVVGNDTFSHAFIGDMSEFRFMPGFSLLVGGDIPLVTRRLFIDANGKPVDPAVATAALGVPGAILFSGDHATFSVNQGNGGAFTVTAGSLTDASTSPSD